MMGRRSSECRICAVLHLTAGYVAPTSDELLLLLLLISIGSDVACVNAIVHV